MSRNRVCVCVCVCERACAFFCEKIVRRQCTRVQALRLCTGRTAHRGSRCVALPFHDHGTRRGEGSASRPGRSLPPGETRYPLYRRLGGPQGRSGQVRKISPPPEFDPRPSSPSPVAIPTELPGPLARGSVCFLVRGRQSLYQSLPPQQMSEFQ
jgi:hypothetical protein